MSVILNTTLPSSMLKKKHNACAYHRVREAIAAKIVNFAHIPSERNISDVLTKPLGPTVFHKLLKEYMFREPKTMIKAKMQEKEKEKSENKKNQKTLDNQETQKK